MDLSRAPLATRAVGRLLESHARLSSTNDRAKALARLGAVHGLAVLAEAQSAGRGTRGRSWSSAPGLGLYVSFLLRPRIAPRHAPALAPAAAVAVARAVESAAGVELGIKWPNDLLARAGRLPLGKVAGVLVEAAADPARIDHVVVGVGVNLREGDRGAALAQYATSVEGAGGAVVPARALFAALALEIERTLDRVERTGFAGTLAEWGQRAVGLGEPVELHTDSKVVHGKLHGVRDDGALLLEQTGAISVHHTGELVIPGAPRRPPDGLG